MDILKPRMNLVFIADQKNMEDLVVMNAVMKKMKMVLRQIISYVIIAFQ